MKSRTIALGILIAALAWPAAPLLRAEPVEGDGADPFDLLLGIIENPDPIPQIHWDGLRPTGMSASRLAADRRDDGRPDFAFDPFTNEPYVTWAYDAGSDHDIAFNAWHAEAWDPQIEFITAGTVDELDPRIYAHTDGTLYLTWWENTAASRMLYIERNVASRGWGAPVEVGAGGRRPSLAIDEDDVLVAFERELAGGGREVVFGRSRTRGPFVFQTVAMTSHSGPLDVVLHARDGHLWMDWKHGTTTLAFSELVDGYWTPPQSRPRSDPTWLGEQTARNAIADLVVR
jgi:hypothetical protein